MTRRKAGEIAGLSRHLQNAVGGSPASRFRTTPLKTFVALLLAATLVRPLPSHAAQPPAASASDAAIHRALEYLRTAQRPDGAWDSGGFGPATSVTSLAVMAFLAAGHVPGRARPVSRVDRPRNPLRPGPPASQRRDRLQRSSHGPMYCHGISTLMLAEVVGMTDDAELAEQARAALVRGGQADPGGAGPSQERQNTPAAGATSRPATTATSASRGWQLMALRAAKSAGCAVPSENIDRAVAYLKQLRRAARRRLRLPARRRPEQPPHRHRHPRPGDLRRAPHPRGRRRRRVPAQAPAPLVQPLLLLRGLLLPRSAMFQMGDKYFLSYYPKLVAILLDHQGKDGSWLSDDGNDRTGGRNYCTAMAVLALAVEYRYLPIYQR